MPIDHLPTPGRQRQRAAVREEAKLGRRPSSASRRDRAVWLFGSLVTGRRRLRRSDKPYEVAPERHRGSELFGRQGLIVTKRFACCWSSVSPCQTESGRDGVGQSWRRCVFFACSNQPRRCYHLSLPWYEPARMCMHLLLRRACACIRAGISCFIGA